MGGAFRPKKSLSQHFLRDKETAARIVSSLDIRASDQILEIGPGEGALTEWLMASQASRIVVVELDRLLLQFIQNRYAGDSRLEAVEGDFLKQDLNRLAAERPLRIIGNLPYRITSPILFLLLENRHLIQDVTVMVQKEVAERLVSPAGSKSYGIPSVFFQLFADMESLFQVSPNSFFPVPAVQSTVVRLCFRTQSAYPVEDIRLFKRIVKSGFGQRRKMLKNSLRTCLKNDEDLEKLDTDLTLRPEQLTVKEWTALSNQITKLNTR